MSPADIERLLQLILLGQQAFLEAKKIIDNHNAQQGKTDEQILADAETKTKIALDKIAAL